MKSRTPIQHWLSDAWSVIRSAFSCRPTPEELEALPLMQLFLSRDALEAIPLPEALTNHAVNYLRIDPFGRLTFEPISQAVKK